MARQGWGKRIPVTGTDSGDTISVNAWNANNKTEGILGFSGKTIASAGTVTIPAFTTVIADQPSSLTILSGSTSVDNIATTNTEAYDLLYVITSGSVTLNDSSTNSGNIHLLGNANIDLSTTVPTILIRVGTAWYEYGGSPVTNASITFAKIQNLATMKVIGRTAASTGVSSEVAILDEDNMASDSATSLSTQQSIKAYVDAQAHSTVTASSTTTFTNKTIDQDATGNSITNIADASIKTSAGIAQSKISNLSTDLSGKSPTAGNSSLVTVGALDSGSITSGFGNIDNGSSTITTTGAVATGAITAGGTITGDLTGNVTGDTSGSSGSTTGNAATATTSTNVTVADESTDTSCNVLFTTAATGALPPKSGTNLTFNSNTGILTSTGFSGPLTGNVTGDASGSSGSCTGNAATSTSAAGLSTALISTSGGTGVTSYTAGDILYYATGTTLTKLAKPGTPAGEVLTFASGATAPTWAAAAGGGATILHDFTIQASTYTGGAASGTTRSVFIRTIDTNNEGVFVKIKKNGTVDTEVQIA